jgi:putative membrane protein
MNRFQPILVALVVLSSAAPSVAQNKLNDLEMAHVAVIASNIDIEYAHIALAFSNNPAIREFAETMIRDHSAVNGQVVALAKKLNVMAQDNAMSQKLLQDSKAIKDELIRLRGAAFDAYYAKNELAYHRAVNGLVADTFLPNIMNAEVKNAFAGALTIFRGHEQHAEQMVGRLPMAMGGK